MDSKIAQAVLGIDVGSTTVKVVLVEPNSKEILWHKYQRHETQQAEKVLALIEEMLAAFPELTTESLKAFITGSGAAPIAPQIGAGFVQEVNAVTLAVEHLHPDVNSVVELGGQDAKIIIFKENQSGGKRAITSMNDKCASGTGATIDKCVIKSGIDPKKLQALEFNPEKLHHVAAKCGVFAETDIVNLVKSGIPAEEIMCSLADAIVGQNLSVLTRGNTLKDRVLLLGGPNTFLPFLQACWRYRIPQTWQERGYEPAQLPIEELIFAPQNAELYAAFGAVLFGLVENKPSQFKGLAPLREFIHVGRKAQLGENAGPGLVTGTDEAEYFSARYQLPSFTPVGVSQSDVIEGVIGLDGGSTSSKCVLINADGTILHKVYQLSQGNPLEDMRNMLSELRQWAVSQGASLNITGFGVTGYAGDVLQSALQADANIVETVAHMKSAQHYFPDVDVICDVGGQDIKVLFMENQAIKNFRLSNSCSAGNGMLLQAMADQFGVPVSQYSEKAFNASLSPTFSYGCAVFLDSDRVNFQKEGYNGEELLAGLALVLPKNIWQYVVQVPRMAELGRIFVLQGGTQKNLAAVKAQVDYICERVPNAEVHVHPHTGEAGALGAAFEALRVVERKGHSTFVGLEEAIGLNYTTRTDESTRCDFCANNCSRTFIDTVAPDQSTVRYISGFSCEKGTVEDYDALRELNKIRKERMRVYPNLVDYEATWTFKSWYKPEALPAPGSDKHETITRHNWFGRQAQKQITRQFERSAEAAQTKRSQLRIGMPKALNMWSTGPFWRAYFEALGVRSRNVVFSDDSSEELWQVGGKYGSVDPCYPAKVVQAHIHNLLFTHHAKQPLDCIFFPSITHIPTFVEQVMDTACCPIVAGTPKVMRATFTKEKDYFGERGIQYFDTAVSLNEPNLLKQKLFDEFAPLLEMTQDESDFAVDQAFKALAEFDAMLQEKGRAILQQVKAENRLALLMTGRPYHNDPGLNHAILEEYQALGYPILSMRSIPKDSEFLEEFFADDLSRGLVESPLEIQDIWPENYSVNSVQKVWATKFAARHPNVAILDLSSFKCGHDAPTYGLVDRIVNAARAPYSAMHDIDANKPSGSIKIRVNTYAYTLGLTEEKLQDKAEAERELARRMMQKRLDLLMAAPESIKSDQGWVNEIESLRTALKLHDKSAEAQDKSVGVEMFAPPQTAQLIPVQQLD